MAELDRNFISGRKPCMIILFKHLIFLRRAPLRYNERGDHRKALSARNSPVLT